MKRNLNILSVGYTRDLWNNNAANETLSRLLFYSKLLNTYHVLTHSSARDNLSSPIKLNTNFTAYATNSRNRLFSLLKLICLGLRVGKHEEIVLVQSQDPMFTGFVGYIISKLLKIPHNTCLYGTNPFDSYWRSESKMNLIGSILSKYVLRRCKGIQVDGSMTKQSLVHFGIDESKIYLKPMIPSNIEEFITCNKNESLRKTLTEDGRKSFLILFVGRMVKQKNLGMLLKVCMRVSKKYSQVRFICVGDGLELKKIKQETKVLGLLDSVWWVGSKAHNQVVEYFSVCDAFILTSLYEGGPRVLMEAAASGKPTVSTNVSGSDDLIVQNESGFIVPVGDVDAFVKALSALIQDPNLLIKMGAAGRDHFMQYMHKYDYPHRQIGIWEKITAK